MWSLMEKRYVVERQDGVLLMVSVCLCLWDESDFFFFFFLVENAAHCEFIHLRNFLTRTHLQDLIETTALIHYETFRAKQLMAIKESTQVQKSNE